MSCNRPEGSAGWHVLHCLEATLPSWHSKQVAIFGSCCRVASFTSVMAPWHAVHSTFLATCTLWLKRRFAGGTSTLGGARRTVASKPGWHVLHPDGGAVFSPFRAASRS